MVEQTLIVDTPTNSAADSSEPQGCKPIRVGLLVDEQFASLWASELIKELQEDPAVDLAVVVRCTGPQLSSSPRRSSLFRLWATLDKWIFRQESDPIVKNSNTYNIETITLRF